MIVASLLFAVAVSFLVPALLVVWTVLDEIRWWAVTPLRPCPRCGHPGGLIRCPSCHGTGSGR